MIDRERLTFVNVGGDATKPPTTFEIFPSRALIGKMQAEVKGAGHAETVLCHTEPRYIQR